MRTVQNKVIVQPIMGDSESLGGIIVPANFVARGAKAKVVAIGPRVTKIPLGVECFHVPGAGDEIEDNGQKYYVMLDTDIRAYAKSHPSYVTYEDDPTLTVGQRKKPN